MLSDRKKIAFGDAIFRNKKFPDKFCVLHVNLVSYSPNSRTIEQIPLEL